MTNSAYSVEIDDLAVGLTRPAMLLGIPAKLLFGNLMLSLLLCVDTHTFYGVPLFLFFHLLMAKFSLKDPNFYRIYVTVFTKTPPVLNHFFWGNTNSYDPW